MDLVKKNILDLQFHKDIIIASTSTIVGITYLVGIGIAFITKQIKFNDFLSLFILFAFSLIILTPYIFFFLRAIQHIKNILTLLKKFKEK